MRYDDPDIEYALDDLGHNVREGAFRLVEINIADLQSVVNMFPQPWTPTSMVKALNRKELLPPVVVIEAERTGAFDLIDGLNRTYAHWVVNRPTIRAYQFLTRP